MRMNFGITLSLTIVLLAAAYFLPRQARQARERGSMTRAEVTRLEPRRDQRGSTGFSNYVRVWVRYTPRTDGEAREAYGISLQRPAWVEEHYPVGAGVEVFVDPERPDLVTLERRPDPKESARVMLIGAGFFALLSLFFGWRAWFR